MELDLERVVRNRSYPIRRTAFESLLRSGYHLTDEEAETVVDIAIEQELLVEREGILDRAPSSEE